MDFSKSSYFAGIGTVVAAIALGFAGGAMITGGPAVQTPNRLERVTSGAALQKSPDQPVVVASVTPQQPATTADPNATPVSEPQPLAQQPTPEVAARSEDIAPHIQRRQPMPPVVARDEDAVTSDRAAELKRTADRKRAQERKFAERKKRQDIEDAANAVRQMKRDGLIDQVVQRDEAPRFGLFGNDNQ